jgi:hypothetical protein
MVMLRCNSARGFDAFGDSAPGVARSHIRPFVGVSQGTVLRFGDSLGAILRRTVVKS